MIIKEITTYTTPQLCVVEVRTDDGLVGIGQTAPQHAAITTKVLHEMVGPFFLDKNPRHVEQLTEEYIRLHYKFFGSFMCRALCGIETALWDVLGKSLELPVYELLGGAVRPSVPVYASSMSRAITPEAEAERLLALIDKHGFRAAKIRVGDRMGNDRDASPGRTEKIIPYIRKALGPDIAINADANSGFSVPRATQVGRILEEYGYNHFEEPCPYTEIENTAKVTAALDIAVAGGEQDTFLPQFRRMAEMRAVDILQPDVGYVGGITRARRVARLAQEFGMACTPHCANQSMLQLFTLHLAAAMPSISQFQEYGIEDNPWSRDLYEPVLQVIDGQFALPKLPGWGVELTDSFLRRADRAVVVA